MEFFDITVPIKPSTPVWPGDPKVIIRQLSAIERGDNVNISQIRMSVHTGTHIDAPKHFIDSGKTIDQISLKKLMGETLVIAINDDVNVISEAVLKSHPQIEKLDRIKKVLFRTRNSLLWHVNPSVFQADYVGIDTSGAEFLMDKDLDLVGVDYLSIATFHDTRNPHLILLNREIVLLEGINLSNVKQGIYHLVCLPFHLIGVEGAPVRAILTPLIS